MKLDLKKGLNKRGKPYAPVTIKNQLVILRRLYNLARKWGLYAGKSPLESLSLLRLDNQKTEFLRDEELAKLLDTLKKWPIPESATFVKFALFTGLKRGEMFKLTWDDVDFERGLVRLRDPKGGKTENLPVGDEAELKKPPDFSRGGRRSYFYGLKPVIFMFRPTALMSRVAQTF
jgi:integrase